MARRNVNLYGGRLGDAEDMEFRQNVEDNFGDLYSEDRNYADELTAAKAGVGFGQLYHTNGAVKVRYSLIPIPYVGQLTLQGRAPSVVQVITRTPTVGSLTLSGVAPVQRASITPTAGSLTLDGKTPAVT